MNRSIPEMLVAVVLAAIVTFVIADLAGGFGTFPNERWAAAIAMMCLAVWIGPGLLRRYAGNANAALKAVALWLLIIVAVAMLYVYGKDFLISIGVNVP
ncbi:hypothetical protein [Chenggangzhangella methanolivorans]|uniref:Uncharacterized protein n=1 Tax=Chenggangzhangella methanolivorans TaxID=1437009 RepID=A0A9E6RBK9_9HYPH|nr:hypothetical protein [Chenggangzhangella methanolivorans]QZO00193.1 hypothetical protein K6K41_27340 [Chenggangzhangella methanolivorans]